MTLETLVSRVVYTASEAQTEFPFGYKFTANADLLVYVDDVLQTSGYTVTGAGLDAGGEVTFSVGLTAGQIVAIARSPAITQEVDYVENDPFPAETHEGALDKLTMICQALNDGLDRSVKLGVGSSLSDITLPEPEANKALVWNAGATALENGPTADDVENAQGYATSAAASASTATIQAGLANTARIAAEAARDAIPAAADILVDSDIGVNVQAYSATALNAAVSQVRTKSHPSTKSAVTSNSLTPDLTTAEVFDWTPTGAATMNAPTIIGAGVWAIRYNYTSGPTLPKATYDGSAWVATGDILLLIGFGSTDYELVWLNKA